MAFRENLRQFNEPGDSGRGVLKKQSLKTSLKRIYIKAMRALGRKRGKNQYLVEAGVAVLCMVLLLFPMISSRSRIENSVANVSPKRTEVKPSATPQEDINIDVFFKDSGTAEQMDLEEYLVGVVSAEMPASYEPEALKAQAVAARTYAYQKMLAGGCKSGYDVCTDYSCCQAYNTGQQRRDKWGGDFDLYEGKIKDAVYATAGELMVYNDQPIQAFFHSTSGGMTEDVQNVFGGDLPYLKGVVSEGEEDAPRFQRTVSMKAKEFVAGIKKIAPSATISADNVADAIGSIDRFESGRVDVIIIGGVSLGGREIRTAFGLDSANFTIAVEGSTVSISTLGYGHGVGMSQAGANAMAKKNSEYRDILLHYYTDIEFTKISNL